MVHKSHEAVKEQSLKGKATAPEKGAAKVGHNSGTVRTLVAELEKLAERKKEIGKAEREVKAKLKEQNVPTMPLNQIMRERKMAADVRANFMQDCHILRDTLEMQTSLFDKDTFEQGQRGPTEAELEQLKKEKAGKPDPVAAAKAMGAK